MAHPVECPIQPRSDAAAAARAQSLFPARHHRPSRPDPDGSLRVFAPTPQPAVQRCPDSPSDTSGHACTLDIDGTIALQGMAGHVTST